MYFSNTLNRFYVQGTLIHSSVRKCSLFSQCGKQMMAHAIVCDFVWSLENHEKWLLREILILWPRLFQSHNHFLRLLLCLTGTRGLKLRAGEGVCRSRWPSLSACGNSTCMNCFCGWKDPWLFWCHYYTETYLDVNLFFKFIFYLKCPLISVQIMIVTSSSVIYSVCCTLHFQQVTIVRNFMTWNLKKISCRFCSAEMDPKTWAR